MGTIRFTGQFAAVTAALLTCPIIPIGQAAILVPATAAAVRQPAAVAVPAADDIHAVRAWLASQVAARRATIDARQAHAGHVAHLIHRARVALEARLAREARIAFKARITRARLAATRAVIHHRHAAVIAYGDPRQVAEAVLADRGQDGQFGCLDQLWERESGWNVHAENPGSGAYGIPQALPGARMAAAGPGWQDDAATQIRWGLDYIDSTYGSPCAAWDHEQGIGWY